MLAEPRDLLVEVGTEELPPKALKRLSQAFGEEIEAGLTEASLGHGELSLYASPRRLAVVVSGLVAHQPPRQIERRGPALKVAFDKHGHPTKAAHGFARACGVDVSVLAHLESAEGSWLVYRYDDPGQATTAIVPHLIESALARLPIPKRMRWADRDAEFVRPVHWVVLLFGSEILDVELMGVRSGRLTRGHRFHCPQSLVIEHPAQYVQLLYEQGYVIASFEERMERIRGHVGEIAESVGGQAVIDPDLLAEVTALVEWPVPIIGSFDARFLELPDRILIASMKGNQKYFHVVDDQHNLMPYFITISNIDSYHPEVVRRGNERVIRPRLEDAAFFYRTDRSQPLADRLQALKGVVFQEKLGSLFSKSQRVSKLAADIGVAMGENAEVVRLARRAGLLSKCDLVTEMVGEFPELQGFMGREYGKHDGEPLAVAEALAEVYMPRFAGDSIPETTCGRIVAISDRIDTLVGIFGIGQSPTGEKDPFALRRAALSVLRILIEGEINLDLEQLLGMAGGAYDEDFGRREVLTETFDFMIERLRAYFLDQGIAPDVLGAVMARHPTRPYDFACRVRAVDKFRLLPEASSLTAANKRIQNILRQAAEPLPYQVMAERLTEPAEQALAEKSVQLRPEVDRLIKRGDYTGAMRRLAGLRDAVDMFFDSVRVMADEEAVRENRLALLNNIRALFLETADISRLQS